MREVDNTYMAVLFLMLALGVCALFVINGGVALMTLEIIMRISLLIAAIGFLIFFWANVYMWVM